MSLSFLATVKILALCIVPVVFSDYNGIVNGLGYSSITHLILLGLAVFGPIGYFIASNKNKNICELFGSVILLFAWALLMFHSPLGLFFIGSIFWPNF